jgi:hypothetical protein
MMYFALIRKSTKDLNLERARDGVSLVMRTLRKAAGSRSRKEPRATRGTGVEPRESRDSRPQVALEAAWTFRFGEFQLPSAKIGGFHASAVNGRTRFSL